jgi:hypothetical protein
MPRTTVEIDPLVLADLKRLQRKEGKPLGVLVSELLMIAIAQRKNAKAPFLGLQWISQPMGAQVNLSDKDALSALEDRDTWPHRPSPDHGSDLNVSTEYDTK